MINSIKYPRGSEWRKWDLHVHTPFSYLNNQFGDDFDNYVKKLFKKAIEKEIAVIGITDYFCIEGYKKIKTNYLTNEKKLKELFSDEEIEKIKNITLFPNIEFRLETLVGSTRVNFHVLFSDNVKIKDIEENFLHELKFVYEGNPQNKDEEWPLNLGNIEELGKKLKLEHAKFQSETDLFIGMQCAVVNDGQIAEVLKNKRSKFEGKYILCVPSNEDISKLSWDGQDHNVRKTLIQKSDVLFCSNKGTISWGLGKKHSTIQEFIDEFKTLKPCIWGSDAHDYKKLFEPDDKRYTWIKADTTFEGLKQITYEPDERVIIQEIKSDEKLSYQVIDSVIFKNENFIDSKIGLNQNLISIIGDKSTGKSILLRRIARSIDSDQVQEKYDKIKEPSLEDPVMEINWKDGEIDNESKKTGRKIIYIPQTFLNEKIDKNEPNSFINTILHDVLVQKNEFRQVIEKIEYVETDINNSINDKINSIFLVQDKISEATKRVNELGNKEYIEKEIAKLDEECKMLHKQGGATSEDIELYNLKNKEYSNSIRLHSINFENLKNLGLILYTADTIKSSDLINFQILHFNSLEYDLHEELNKQFATLKDSTKMAISYIFNLKFNEIYSEIKILKHGLEELNASLTPLKNKLDFSDTIQKKADLLKNEEHKLITFNDEMKSLTRLKSEFEKTIDEVIKLNADYENKLNDLKKQLPPNIFIDVNFTIDILFNESKFNDTMKDLLNSKKFSAFKEKTDIDLSNFKFVNSSDFNLSLKKIIIGILEKDLPTKSKYTPKDGILYLLQNWYFFKYNVEEEGDKLENMSPGKRSFILLKILIDLDNSKWPILIDQPEDDLDAKSVSKQLIKYLKEKKKDRQIIIVSHNPNLVVGADSEQIIVANQHGSNLKNRSKQFEYVMGSIEDTFINQEEECILYSKGIKEHICDILEGGEEAFKMRQSKYNIK
jgi:ABC-type cobalamin/Fe3+-siderophores transport system ATPase subunit